MLARHGVWPQNFFARFPVHSLAYTNVWLEERRCALRGQFSRQRPELMKNERNCLLVLLCTCVIYASINSNKNDFDFMHIILFAIYSGDDSFRISRVGRSCRRRTRETHTHTRGTCGLPTTHRFRFRWICPRGKRNAQIRLATSNSLSDSGGASKEQQFSTLCRSMQAAGR